MSKDDTPEQQMAKLRAMEALGFKLRWINHYHCKYCAKDWTHGYAAKGISDTCNRCGRDFIPSFYESEWVNENEE